MDTKTAVYIEVGENLRLVLVTAINAASNDGQNIGETLSKMGFDLKEIVRVSILSEVSGGEQG